MTAVLSFCSKGIGVRSNEPAVADDIRTYSRALPVSDSGVLSGGKRVCGQCIMQVVGARI